MTITKNINEDSMTIAIEGRLDTTTAPQLEAEIQSLAENIKNLEVDLSAVDYVSSAGLRVMLVAYKKMTAAAGTFAVSGATPSVKEVFDMTGFSKVLNLK